MACRLQRPQEADECLITPGGPHPFTSMPTVHHLGERRGRENDTFEGLGTPAREDDSQEQGRKK